MTAHAITTGITPAGIRFAHFEGYRILAYAEGGYACNRRIEGIGWCLFDEAEGMPENVERALCLALGINYAG